MLNESLDGNLVVIIYHLAENKINENIEFYKNRITESTINKMKNELKDFFLILLSDKNIVEKIIYQCEVGKVSTNLPVIKFEVNVGNKRLNSFMINWLDEVFDSNREEMDNYIDSFDVFKNKNLIETYTKKPKNLVNLIKKNPDWQEYLELTYAV